MSSKNLYDFYYGIGKDTGSYATGKIQKEKFVMSDGQTAVILTDAYPIGMNLVEVFINGIRQDSSVYVETDSHTITFSEALTAGDVVEVTTFRAVSVNTVNAENVSYDSPDGILRNVGDLADDTDMLKGVSLVGGAERVVDSIASLRLLPKTGSSRVFVSGYYSVGDGGGGHYYYDSSDTTSADNGGTNIVANDGGRWKLFYTGSVSVKQFGAKGDGTTDDTSAIASAITALPATGGTLFFPGGIYVTNTITLPLYPKNIAFLGFGRELSLLKPKNQNQKVINSTGVVTGIGGARFSMKSMGVVPHNSGSTAMAFDFRNISNSIVKDFAFVQNGSSTFDIGFELYAEDSPTTINCYYNRFEDIYVVKTGITGTLPIKQVFKLYGNTGNHIIDHLTVSGTWPTATRPAIQISTYCRHNIVSNSNFEGLALTGTNTVISDQGYGNSFVNNYFENTGQPYYFGAEIETGSREWAVIEKNAFAANTIDSTTTPSLVNGAVFRDSYAFGGDATVLAAIRKLQQPTWTVTLTPDSGTITLSQNIGAYSVDSNKLVTCTGQFIVSSVTSPSNNVYFNLPIAAANGTEFAFSGSVNLFGCNPISGNLILRRQSGQNIAYISYVDTSGNIQPAASLFKAGSTLEIGFSYFSS